MHTTLTTTLLLTLTTTSTLAQLTSSASTAAPTSSVSSPSGCGESVDLIIADCLKSTGLQLSACTTNDWDCMCTQQTNVLTCYNNCPSDPNRFAAESQQTSWCNAAKQFGTSTPAAASQTSGTSRASSSAGSGSSAMPTGSSSSSDAESTPSSSATGDAPASSSTDNAAVANVVPGALAVFLGLAVLL